MGLGCLELALLVSWRSPSILGVMPAVEDTLISQISLELSHISPIGCACLDEGGPFFGVFRFGLVIVLSGFEAVVVFGWEYIGV